MNKKLGEYIKELERQSESIPAARRQTLDELAGYVQSGIDGSRPVKLNFICTHNSRRSHLAQIWSGLAAVFYGVDAIETYSGGTEATAIHPNAVAALQRAGFSVHNPGGDNPKIEIGFSEDHPPFLCFSKKYEDPANPSSGFAAVMTCSDADENCPHVPGAEFRIAVTYRDPKEADGSQHESETYDERCRQIATEMFYMVRRVKSTTHNNH